MYLKRKIYSQLLDWKQNRNGNVALLIEGARRIGKNFVATPVVLHTGDLKTENGVEFLPVYMTGCL
jgi:hypothetical protein